MNCTDCHLSTIAINRPVVNSEMNDLYIYISHLKESDISTFAARTVISVLALCSFTKIIQRGVQCLFNYIFQGEPSK